MSFDSLKRVHDADWDAPITRAPDRRQTIPKPTPRLPAGQSPASLLQTGHTLHGAVLVGVEGRPIQLQARAVDLIHKPKSWCEAVTITGLARGANNEALTRIAGAFAKLGLPQPCVDILVNLAPADLVKEGTWLDLPLAVVLLQAAGLLPSGIGFQPVVSKHDRLDSSPMKNDRLEAYPTLLFGELSIHGDISSVPGALPLALVAQPGQTLIVPSGNVCECSLLLAQSGYEKCSVLVASTLQEVIDHFHGRRRLAHAAQAGVQFTSAVPAAIDLSRIRGQDRAKRALVISAAGGHNLLMIGPPGEGKSLLASALPGLLPKLSPDEMLQLTKLYSASGALPRDGSVVTKRPLRSVHHTASMQSVIGGGSGHPRPGEITLAHFGVLFLDELAEFNRGTLEALRQPIETGEVHISRVKGTLCFPSRFTLVAAMNPCPCGYHGSDRCRCSTKDVTKYQQKLSGPILDRIDLQVVMDRLTVDERFADATEETSPRVRAEVEAARDIQQTRFRGTSISTNAAIPGGHVREYCSFSEDGLAFFKSTLENSQLSTRSMDRLAKVSRTIADLAGATHIEPDHIDEAASFVLSGQWRTAGSD